MAYHIQVRDKCVHVRTSRWVDSKERIEIINQLAEHTSRWPTETVLIDHTDSVILTNFEEAYQIGIAIPNILKNAVDAAIYIVAPLERRMIVDMSATTAAALGAQVHVCETLDEATRKMAPPQSSACI